MSHITQERPLWILESKVQRSRSQVIVVNIWPQINFWMTTVRIVFKLDTCITHPPGPQLFLGSEDLKSRSFRGLFTNFFLDDNCCQNQTSPNYHLFLVQNVKVTGQYCLQISFVFTRKWFCISQPFKEKPFNLTNKFTMVTSV